MTKKAGPSQEYRDMVQGKISTQDYLKKLKREASERVSLRPSQRRAASG